MVSHPIEFVALLCFIHAIETIIGLSLNLYIIIKWYNESRKLNNKTKLHGNNFISALKLIDLIVCSTAIPLSFAALIVNAANNFIVCFIKEGLVMFYSSGSSLCVLLISVDRYIAVVLPTKQPMTPFRIKLCRIAVPVVALIGMALPFLSLFMGLYSSAQSQISSILPCRHVLWVFKPYYFYELYYVIIFIIALITTFLCYRSVLTVVHRRIVMRTTIISSTSSSSQENANIGKLKKQELKATRVAFLVVLSFLVCWVPHMVLTVIQYAYPEIIIIDMVQAVSLAIAFLAPIIHPVIYTYETRDISNSENKYCGLALCCPLLRVTNRVIPNTTNIYLKSVDEVSQNTSGFKQSTPHSYQNNDDIIIKVNAANEI